MAEQIVTHLKLANWQTLSALSKKEQKSGERGNCCCDFDV